MLQISIFLVLAVRSSPADLAPPALHLLNRPCWTDGGVLEPGRSLPRLQGRDPAYAMQIPPFDDVFPVGCNIGPDASQPTRPNRSTPLGAGPGSTSTLDPQLCKSCVPRQYGGKWTSRGVLYIGQRLVLCRPSRRERASHTYPRALAQHSAPVPPANAVDNVLLPRVDE